MPRFTSQWLDELRARVTLSAVIGRDVRLVKAGREYKACCPFHGEKTPSFTVNDEKAFGHCFGCGWHGDAIRFLTEHRGMGFVEACEELAAEAGMELPAVSAEAQRRAVMIEGQRPTLEAAAAIFAGILHDGPAGPREWLAARGVDAATARAFDLGFAPEHGALGGKGFGQRELRAVGLIGKTDTGFIYPRFRSRIMVPIHDARGRIVGFGGRVGPGAKAGAAKYVNSPECEIFDKGRTLFNLHRARERYRATRRLVVAEGYFDVIALHRVGVAAVAPMGTALTEGQLELAWRVDPCPLLLFDGDAAGTKAAVRACETALPMMGPGRSLAIGALPAGVDPDELVQTSVAAGEDPAMALAAWLAANPPMSLQECLLNDVLSGVPEDAAPEAWAAAWDRLADYAARIADDDVRVLTLRHWRRRWELAAELIGDTKVKVRLTPIPVDEGWACDACGLATDPRAGCLKAGHCRHRDGIEIDVDGGITLDGDDERVQSIVLWLVGAFDDIAAIQYDIKFRLGMAKEMGFDPPMLRKMARAVIQDRDKPDTRTLKEAREAAYRRAIGLKGPMTEEMLPPPFAIAGRGGKGGPALPPPTRRIEAMTDMIEGRE